LIAFQKQIADALEKGSLVFKIKDLELSILRKVDEKIKETADPLRDKVDAIEASAPQAPGASVPKKTLSRPALLTIIRKALSDSRYTWRSVERLTKIAGVDETEVVAAITSEDATDIVLSNNPAGEQIAKLKSRSSSKR